jgi:uncharacterized protein YndB with AHSA1/START domain
METKEKTTITIEALVKAPVKTVWQKWSGPEHIKKWCQASDDWHVPAAENDLRVGGKFKTRMEAKDGSMGFDFGGTYTDVREHKHIAYTLDDERKVSTTFTDLDGKTNIVQSFEAENINPIEMQRTGWQAILNSFKSYVE